MPSASRSRDVPSSSVPAHAARRHGLAEVRAGPRRRRGSVPQRGTKQNATRSPGASPVDARVRAPRRRPRPRGRARSASARRPSCPSARCRSVWQTPAAATRTSTSPARGGSSVDLARPRAAGPAVDEHRRARSPSSDPERLERVEVGRRRRGPARAAGRSCRRGRSRAAPAAASRAAPGVQRRRVERDLDERAASRPRSARCRFASSPSPFDHVCGENSAAAQVGERGDPAAAAEPAGEHGVGLDRRRRRRAARRSRASAALRTISPAAIRSDGAPAQRARSRRRRRSGAAPRASRRRAARAPARTAPRSRRPSAARGRPPSASPGWRRPSARRRGPTASRTASTTATSSRQSAWWKRSLTARTPRVAQRDDARARAPPVRPARRSTRRRAAAPSARRAAARAARRARGRRGPRPPPRRSTAGRRGSRRSRRSRARPRSGAGRARPAGRSSSAASGSSVAARVAREPVVGAHDHERRLDRASRGTGIPGGAERRVERRRA